MLCETCIHFGRHFWIDDNNVRELYSCTALCKTGVDKCIEYIPYDEVSE